MAYDLLPEQYIAGKMHVSYSAGRANKFAAAAMLSRAYFYMGNYTEASTYADFVISQNGGVYDLTEDPIEAFNKSSSSFVTESTITEQMINDERLIELFCDGDRIDYLRGLKEPVGNGERGVCGFVRAAAYSSIPAQQYFKDANQALVIIQLEGKEGVQYLSYSADVGIFTAACKDLVSDFSGL